MPEKPRSIKALIDYIARYDPGFPGRIRGAPESVIHTLEQIVGMPLPLLYREFLSYMGQDNGGLEIHSDATTNIDEVIDYYRDRKELELGFPENCIVIAVRGTDVPDLSLELSGALRVFLTSGTVIKGLVADSFENLLFQEAFIGFRMPALPRNGIYTNRTKSAQLAAARELALSMGFRPLWFSDSITFCGEAEQAAIYINQYEKRGLFVRLQAVSKEKVDQLALPFIRDFGVEFQMEHRRDS
jgi:tRNA threonylcarbamoyladenosine modification (KEOPS) complex  Pcc1 subunit